MKEKPIRIQRKRTKGWRMPENSVSVCRPGRFGNPFEERYCTLEESLKLFENMVRGVWDPFVIAGYDSEGFGFIYGKFLRWNERIRKCGYRHPQEAVRMELRGKNLACFCPLDKPCHADVLLRIANEPINKGETECTQTQHS